MPNFLDRIKIDIIYYFITCIIFKLDKRFKRFAMQIKKDPPKNYKSKIYVIAYYLTVNQVENKQKLLKKAKNY